MAANGDLYIAELESHAVRKVTAATGIISTVASGLNEPLGVAYDDANDALCIADMGAIIKVSGGTTNPSWFTTANI